MTRLAIAAALAVTAAGTARGQQFSPADYYFAWQDARAAQAEGRFEEAQALWTQLAEVTPDNATLWLRLAETRVALGQLAEALVAGARAYELGLPMPANRVAYRIAAGYGGAGQVDSARAWLERALDSRYSRRESIQRDNAFAAMRAQPDFATFAGIAPAGLTRDDGWRYDLDFLVTEIRRLRGHLGGRPLPQAPFTAAEALRADIPRLTDDQIALELIHIVALIGDGHSWLSNTGATPAEAAAVEVNTRILPVQFWLFDDGMYVIDAAAAERRWIGSRVVRIGDLTVDEVVRRLTPYVPRDNAQGVKWMGVVVYLPRLLVLQGIGATDDPGSARLVLEDREGRMHEVTLAGGEHRLSRTLTARDDEPSPPLHLQQRDHNYWATEVPGRDAVYFQFNAVQNAGEGPSIAQFADTLRGLLERSQVSNLIVDVRHNGGGNNTLVRPLVRTLVWFEMASPSHQLYVITGRETFSAAQNFINRIERIANPIVVGEPSGSKPNFVGESSSLTLPYSGLKGSMSNRYWQDSDDGDDRAWIAPHVPVTMTADDYFGNRDPVIEAIWEVIARKRGPA